ncbi:hypothetical protein C8R45DRAFT_1131869, partial [Mycena sanguinolenta]
LTISGAGVYYIKQYNFFLDAPALHCVVLGTRGASLPWNIDLPWAQLTTCEATYNQASMHFDNLATAANLVVCDLACSRCDTTLCSPLTLPRLRCLAVSHPVLLKRLFTPMLQSLYTAGPGQRPRVFARTSTLKELTLAKCAAPASEVIGLLKQTCGLTKLVLDLHSPPAGIVAQLTAPDCICPNLESLSWADFGDGLNRNAVVDMVVSRCGAFSNVSRLRFFAVYAGPRRMNTAGWRLRNLPGVEVLIVNAKKGMSAVARWNQRACFIARLDHCIQEFSSGT